MNFRVLIEIEAPIISKRYELFVPVDRRIHDLLSVLKSNIPELSKGYYKNNTFSIYNKSSGELYNNNLIIKDTNIKMGTRLVLI